MEKLQAPIVEFADYEAVHDGSYSPHAGLHANITILVRAVHLLLRYFRVSCNLFRLYMKQRDLEEPTGD